jgi:glutathione S-transferase
MKLYYHPWACSLAPVIVAAEAGIALDLVYVDILSEPHTLLDGTLYSTVNARHYVPLLVRENGEPLTEVAAILQYLARPARGRLAPLPTAPEHVELQQWLTFVATELHKMYSPWLFHPEVGEAAQEFSRGKISNRYAFVEHHLAGRDYLLGTFTIADAYLFVTVNWAAAANTPLEDFPNIRAWFERMNARPAIKEALRAHSVTPKQIAAEDHVVA